MKVIETENFSLAVIIPTLDREESLIRTLGSVLSQTVPPTEIIVVDQSDTVSDTMKNFCRKHDITFVHITGKGSHRARNKGLTLATADIVFFCDDDCDLQEEVLERHRGNYSDHRVGAVGGRLIQPQEEKCSGAEIKPGTFNCWTGKITGKFYSTRNTIIDHFSGGNCSCLRTVLMQTGGYDENFGGNAFFEETDVALRIGKLGYKIVFEPAACAIHRHCDSGGNRTRTMEQWVYWYSANYLLLFMRHGKTLGLPILCARLFLRWLWWSLRHKSASVGWAGARGFLDRCKNRVLNRAANGYVL